MPWPVALDTPQADRESRVASPAMVYRSIIYLAVVTVAYALFSRRLSRSPITGPMFFATAGLLGDAAGAWDPIFDLSGASVLLELTLGLVLFTEAMKLRLRSWEEDFELPTRLIGIGMPLTILAGTVAAVILLDVNWLGAAVIATVLAPTDAALGVAVVENPKVPARIREALAVESGLNDGIALPVLLFFIAALGTEEGVQLWSLALEAVGVGMAVGIVFGGLIGFAVRDASRRGWMQDQWQEITVVVVSVASLIVADELGGSGFIATFVAGLVFGHLIRHMDESVADFGDDVGAALTMLSFALFGGLILGDHLDAFALSTIVFAVLALTLARMVPVAISMTRTGLERPTVLFMGWFGPRGLASIIFAAIVAEEFGIVDAAPVIDAMVVTVTLSIFLHGATAFHGSEFYGDWYLESTRRL